MNIILSTTVSNSATDVIEAAQQLAGFEIAVYQRSGSDVQPFGFNFFATSPSGGATWDGQYLRIGFEKKGVDPRVHVDLEWDQTSQAWSGTFERGAFRSQAIALKRPAGHKNSRLIGTWFERDGLMNNCLHIAEAQDGTFTGWGDDIQIPDRMRYAYGLRPPDHVTEHYGEIAKIPVSIEVVTCHERKQAPDCNEKQDSCPQCRDDAGAEANGSVPLEIHPILHVPIFFGLRTKHCSLAPFIQRVRFYPFPLGRVTSVLYRSCSARRAGRGG
jgi:hypothetical protein